MNESRSNGDHRSALQRARERAIAAANGRAARELPRVTAADVATVADLARAGAALRWVWERWLPLGVAVALAAPAGTGKTRFLCDLVRRIRHGLPWPDGAPMTAPGDAQSLWVLADNHHDQIVDEAGKFGIADALRVNAPRSDPYDGVTLDTVDDYLALEARVKAVRPLLVVVDTVGNSTEKSLSRQEDAKAYYQPLQVLARRYACAVVCVTHLNAAGQFLGRRVLEKVRVALQLEKFPHEERLRLSVPKSLARKPPPLGVTMGTGRFDYDDHPPAPPEDGGGPGGGRPGAEPARLDELCAWLREALANGRRRVYEVRADAEAAGFSSKTLYAAKRRLGVAETEGATGGKWWALDAADGREATF